MAAEGKETTQGGLSSRRTPSWARPFFEQPPKRPLTETTQLTETSPKTRTGRGDFTKLQRQQGPMGKWRNEPDYVQQATGKRRVTAKTRQTPKTRKRRS